MEFNSQTLQPNTQLGNFKIIDLLGQGGFGITYKAVHGRLGREFAIKEYMPSGLGTRGLKNSVVVSKTDAETQDLYKRGLTDFIEEAVQLANLSSARHPNIVNVSDFFEANNTAYIVMEYLDGDTLDRAIKRSDFPRDEPSLKKLALGILDGLEHVHEVGLLHRDLKPANVCLTSTGTPVIIDFGTVKSVDLISRVSTYIPMSEGYSPLEQLTNPAEIGCWSDIYAFGMTMRKVISNENPVGSISRWTKLVAGEADPVKPLAEIIDNGISKHFLKAIDWCTESAHQDRPQSIPLLKQALTNGDQYNKNERVEEPREGDVVTVRRENGSLGGKKGKKSTQLGKWFVGLGVFALLVVLGLSYLFDKSEGGNSPFSSIPIENVNNSKVNDSAAVATNRLQDGGPTIDIIEPKMKMTANGPTIRLPSYDTEEIELVGKLVPSSIIHFSIDGDKVAVNGQGIFIHKLNVEKASEAHLAVVGSFGKPTKLTLKIERPLDFSIIDFGNYHALIIGNAQHEHMPQLDTSLSDLKTLADLLQEKYGFTTQLLFNASRGDILKALAEYRKNLKPEDNLLVYYNGHMASAFDNGYWLPVDAEPDNDVNWVPRQQIYDFMDTVSAKHILVLENCGYSGQSSRDSVGTISESDGSLENDITRGVNSIQAKKYYRRVSSSNVRTSISSGKCNRNIENIEKLDHSLFTSVILDNLKRAKVPAVDTYRLFIEVKKRLTRDSAEVADEWIPEYLPLERHDTGTFLFVQAKYLK